MALKRYVCTRHPNLSIRSSVQFVNGLFETSIPSIQKLIEQNDLWNGGIREVPQVPDIDPVAPVIPEMDAAVAAVMSGEELIEVADDALDIEPIPEPSQHSLDVEETLSKPINELTATDINRMNKPDLKALADEIGAEVPRDRRDNLPNLKRAVKLSLDIGA